MAVMVRMVRTAEAAEEAEHILVLALYILVQEAASLIMTIAAQQHQEAAETEK